MRAASAIAEYILLMCNLFGFDSLKSKAVGDWLLWSGRQYRMYEDRTAKQAL